MRNLKRIILLIVGLCVISIISNLIFNNIYSSKNFNKHEESQNYQSKIKTIPQKNILNTGDTDSLIETIGKPFKQVKKQRGEPKSKNLSANGYESFTYNESSEEYIQFGVIDGKVVTAFIIGDFAINDELAVGMTYKQLNEEYHFENSIDFSTKDSDYQFKLTDEDMSRYPLIKITEDIFMQLYFDMMNDQLIGLRMINGDILLAHQPYQIVYRGEFDTAPKLSDKQWLEVSRDMEKQVFDITNVIRNIYLVESLTWDDSVSEVAFQHSEDMKINNYFSHDNLKGLGLKERLAEEKIGYLSAGENIAAEYIDSLDVVAGWLNSEGHREALLNQNFTHLGVGIYHLYYTQNFVEKP